MKGGQKLMEMSKRKKASKKPEPVEEPTVPTQRFRNDTPLRLDQMSGPADMEIDNFAPPVVNAPPPLPEEQYVPFDFKQFANNISTIAPPPVDPREEKLNSINEKVDVLMDTFRQTLEEQKARQEVDDIARQQELEKRGPIDVGYNPNTGASQSYPENYGTIQAPPPPPPQPVEKPKPVEQAAPVEQVAPVEEAVTNYSYELSTEEILNIGADVPNDKLLVAPRYNSFDEMNAQFNDSLKQGWPLPPVAYVGDTEVKVAEMEQLKRFVMSADDIQSYNLSIVNTVAEQALGDIEGK
ncbi:MAG: hypothetical protein CMM02_18395 [Rhodopirellula sp.]|nr:hypothetical protein [Rhodopirellula sp.]MAT12970.1 hypothetical protein [Rhodopirellula sp.]|tara:strand:+ start:18741 stop:19628 length:888 start_codon:yes stop_codon:yes gene_type:complete